MKAIRIARSGLAFCLLVGASTAMAASWKVFPVATSGMIAPHDAALTLEGFPDPPVIGNNNKILFKAIDSAGQVGLFSSTPMGTPVTLLLQGDPGITPDFIFTDFIHYEVADVTGDVLLVAKLQNQLTLEVVRGVFLIEQSTGVLSQLAQEQVLSPVGQNIIVSLNPTDDTSVDPPVFADALSAPPVINELGHVAFYAKEDSAEDAILFGDASGLEVAARNGDEVDDGNPANTLVIADSLSNNPGLEGTRTLVLNDADVLGFHGGTDEQPYALFMGPSQQIGLVYQQGDSVPLTTQGDSFQRLILPAINDSNDLFFSANYQASANPASTDSGLHHVNQDTQVETYVLQEGSPVNASSDLYEDTWEVAFYPTSAINNNNVAALQGKVLDSNTLEVKQAMLGGPLNQIGILAREGDSVGAADAFAVNNENGLAFFAPVVNDQDIVMFGAGLNSGDESGLFMYEMVGGLHNLVLPGDQFDPGGGVQESVESLKFQGGSGNHDGRPSGFNDFNVPVLKLDYGTGSGIFILNICDLNKSGRFDTNDVKLFTKTCHAKQSSPVGICDQNFDGGVTKSDRRDFIATCR